jgi:hypothetical protein
MKLKSVILIKPTLISNFTSCVFLMSSLSNVNLKRFNAVSSSLYGSVLNLCAVCLGIEPWLSHSCAKNYCSSIVYSSKIYYHASLYDTILVSGAGVAAT